MGTREQRAAGSEEKERDVLWDSGGNGERLAELVGEGKEVSFCFVCFVFSSVLSAFMEHPNQKSINSQKQLYDL